MNLSFAPSIRVLHKSAFISVLCFFILNLVCSRGIVLNMSYARYLNSNFCCRNSYRALVQPNPIPTLQGSFLPFC